ncbi:cytochrome P450 [Actinomadura soli]|uniref:Cytochrome P450 n=1 Tax=Actinomadura soli TaxID=2508997 RepID=A0A5C4JCC2_9ACTN|nr:cytochrome P450 [Actinomadura soli]
MPGGTSTVSSIRRPPRRPATEFHTEGGAVDLFYSPFDFAIQDEETLRWDPPSQALARTATEDVDLHGVTIPADARVLLLVGSANHDPDVFDAPSRFDLDRDTGPSLAFGNGRHHCLGANLGRLEARIALTELTTAIADYDIDMARARRVRSSNDRGFASLPTQITRRR